MDCPLSLNLPHFLEDILAGAKNQIVLFVQEPGMYAHQCDVIIICDINIESTFFASGWGILH